MDIYKSNHLARRKITYAQRAPQRDAIERGNPKDRAQNKLTFYE